MSDQFFTDGDTFEQNGQTFEVVAVSYQETPEGERHNYTYSFRLKSEVDAERAAAPVPEQVAPSDDPNINQPTEG